MTLEADEQTADRATGRRLVLGVSPNSNNSGGSTFGLPAVVHLFVFFFLVATLIGNGYRVYLGGNHPLQIPLVHSLNDPTLFPDDPFAETLPHYASIFWRMVAPLARQYDLEDVLLALFLLERLLMFYAAACLAGAILPGSLPAMAGAMAILSLGMMPLLGSGTLSVNYLEQTGFSVPFYLLALAALFQERPVWFAVFYGLGFDLNSLYGVHAGSYFVLSFLFDPDLREQWRKWLVSIPVFLLVASPGLFMSVAVFTHVPADNELWLAASRFRFPHHLLPSTWETASYIKFCLLYMIFVGLTFQVRRDLPRLFHFGLAWALVCIGWLGLAFVAEEINSTTLFLMQPGRGGDLWYVWGTIAILCVCGLGMARGEGARHVYLLPLLATVFFWQPPPVHILLFFLMLAVWTPVRWLAAGNKGAAFLVVAAVLVGSALRFQTRFDHSNELKASLLSRPSSQDFDLAEWAQENTPKNAQFLVAPTYPLFRALARRPVFTSWKEGSALLWDRSFAPIWVERMSALGYDVRQPPLGPREVDSALRELYRNLGDDDVLRLTKKYPLDYWTVRPSHVSEFKVRYRNSRFKVLEIPRPNAGATRTPPLRPPARVDPYPWAAASLWKLFMDRLQLDGD